MKKIKLLIASMIGAIALVFAAVLGTKVNATDYTVGKTSTLSSLSNNNKYTLNASTVYTETGASVSSGEKKDSQGEIANAPIYDVFQFSTAKAWGFSNNWSSVNGIGILAAGSGRTITLRSSGAQIITLSFEMFVTASNTNTTTYKIGNGSSVTITNGECGEGKAFSALGTVQTVSTTFTTDSAQDIVITMGNKHGFTSLSASAVSNDVTLSSIAISGNSTTADVGDAIPTTSDMTITATYSDNSNANVTSASTITVKNKSTDASITGTYPSAGTYTVTASYTFGDDTETASYDVIVSDVTYYTITYYDVDGTTSHEANVKQGENFEVTLFKGGYSFLGWSTTQGNTTADFTTTNIQAAATVYPVFSSSPVTLLEVNKTYNLDVTKSGITSTVYQSNSSDNTYFIDNAEAGKGVKKDGNNFSFGNGLSNDKNYLGIIIPAHSYAIITLTAKRATDSDATKYARLYFNDENTQTGDLTTSFADYSVMCSNNSDSFSIIRVYRNGNKTVTVSSFSVQVKSSMNTDTTASVFAEKNTAGDTLRFVGTITGINDLADIKSIELILTKGGVATKKQIFLNNCYTSVKNCSQECKAADGTYYVIYRLTGVSGLSATFTKQLKVTFTDGSTTLSDNVEFSI